jgi:hypothetical protein
MAEKYVLVIDAALPLGLIANTAAVLGVSVGRREPHLVGAEAEDGSGGRHGGLIQVTLPVLKADPARIAELRRAALQHPGLKVIDVSEAAQRNRTYPDYLAELKAMTDADIRYLGIALYGEAGAVKALTGSLPLLR